MPGSWRAVINSPLSMKLTVGDTVAKYMASQVSVTSAPTSQTARGVCAGAFASIDAPDGVVLVYLIIWAAQGANAHKEVQIPGQEGSGLRKEQRSMRRKDTVSYYF